MGKQGEGSIAYTQNRKMKGSSIVMCPEIEGIDKCIYFGSGLCKNCYAENLWPRRKQGWRGRGRTPASGVIRLGTWREMLPEDYEKFKKLFPERDFFLITRGLLKQEFYREIDRDPHCLNMQVSVDINDGRIVPSEKTIGEFLLLDKTLFRFKTREDNVEEFLYLANRLCIPKKRILETPLRLKKGDKERYTMSTPLSTHWNRGEFWLCNTECSDCQANNGVTICSTAAVRLFE